MLCAGALHGGPAQHHRAAVHGFARQHLVVVVDDAGAVHGLAARHGGVGVHDDADKVVVPAQRVFRRVGRAQVQQRQAGLGGHVQRHGVGHFQPMRAGEFLAVEKMPGDGAQACLLSR